MAQSAGAVASPSCPECGYACDGLPSIDGMVTCPECGQIVRPAVRQKFSFTVARTPLGVVLLALAPSVAMIVMVWFFGGSFDGSVEEASRVVAQFRPYSAMAWPLFVIVGLVANRWHGERPVGDILWPLALIPIGVAICLMLHDVARLPGIWAGC
jgi:uncharacterized paraquat-inducible protein A